MKRSWKTMIAAANIAALSMGGVAACGGSDEESTEMAGCGGCAAAGGCGGYDDMGGCGADMGGCGADMGGDDMGGCGADMGGDDMGGDMEEDTM